MKINIKTNNRTYFRQLTELLSPIEPFSKLTNREKDVFALFQYYNFAYRNMPKEDRFSYLFSNDMRDKIRGELNISQYHLNNIISCLRRKDFMTYDSIRVELPIERQLTYNFIEVKEDEN